MKQLLRLRVGSDIVEVVISFGAQVMQAGIAGDVSLGLLSGLGLEAALKTGHPPPEGAELAEFGPDSSPPHTPFQLTPTIHQMLCELMESTNRVPEKGNLCFCAVKLKLALNPMSKQSRAVIPLLVGVRQAGTAQKPNHTVEVKKSAAFVSMHHELQQTIWGNPTL